MANVMAPASKGFAQTATCKVPPRAACSISLDRRPLVSVPISLTPSLQSWTRHHSRANLLQPRHGAVADMAAAAPAAASEASGLLLMNWLRENGAPAPAVEIQTVQLVAARRPLDVLVAKEDLKAGTVAISIPERLTVTLGGIFQSEFVAELLTSNKLSELACLALYLMYEKKIGRKSFWYPYIKELDKQRARGVQAVESPLLWEEEELDTLLQGSPLLAAVKQRLDGIRQEYEQLDTVWFMAGSLFNKYPFDIPTEAFSFKLFKQAFAAVQASIVHLQGVPAARRFSLVPLGPPLLSYSSTCKAMLKYNAQAQSVELITDVDVPKGSPVYAWCGPQPNSRLLLNYGIVDESNPYDKLQLSATLPNTDPLFKAKRAKLVDAGLATQMAFDLSRAKPLPPMLMPYLRIAFASTQQEVDQVSFEENAPPSSNSALEQQAQAQLTAALNRRLAAYQHPLSHDLAIIDNPESTPRQRIAARLTKIEKGILLGSLEELSRRHGDIDANKAAALQSVHWIS